MNLVIAVVVFIRENMSDFGLIHGVQQRLDFIGTHKGSLSRIYG